MTLQKYPYNAKRVLCDKSGCLSLLVFLKYALWQACLVACVHWKREDALVIALICQMQQRDLNA
jgi:hypothetical protein